MSNVGYIRVSSYGQNTDRQLVGVDLQKIFEEKASAKDAQRPQLAACMEWLRDGDTLHVHSIDRLARNLSDLQQIVDELNSKGVTVRFHKEFLTFSGSDDPMQRLMLQMMGAFAEFERALINERRREGMAAAKLKGKQIGAKRKLSFDDIASIRQRLALGESKKALAEEYSVTRQTLYTALARKH
ncbi:MAG: recombinase family protein [Candidatus Thiodiazotropha sp. (ex Lucina aurantia)]|nr:recombinase family protein [Candidatus Thiodiazotropha taylori]MBV2098753.1 recombinase family protein [Candidatus Thiodiazotropha sp. (ex Codakia orbicularis)]MBV2103671.1 recombinase family protein [Candidatus Thiodiazotropha sp. (ex Lucina aurantia)]MBV2118110.1 recombinase family protein [Candidatus Thiodiazotropha sp. (ex Lucina aurantia)]